MSLPLPDVFGAQKLSAIVAALCEQRIRGNQVLTAVFPNAGSIG
jgi:hypothetical protein